MLKLSSENKSKDLPCYLTSYKKKNHINLMDVEKEYYEEDE